MTELNITRIYIGCLVGIFLIAVVVLGASVCLGNSGALIISDGKGYYVWVRSLLLDGDINFVNDYQLIYPPDMITQDINRRTPVGFAPNKYPIGLAILEIPGFLIGHAIANLGGFAPNGISLPYQLSVTLSLAAFVLVSFYWLYQALRNYGIRAIVAGLVCLMALIGSNLIHYIAKEPGMVHASNVALINSLIFLSSLDLFHFNPANFKHGEFQDSECQNPKLDHPKYSNLYRYLVGVLIGWLMINRNTNVVLLPVLTFVFWHRETRLASTTSISTTSISAASTSDSLTRAVSIRAFWARAFWARASWIKSFCKRLLPYGLGLGCMVSLQLLALYHLWGGFRIYSYEGENFTGELAGVFGTLFSSAHGLFIYHPWYMILLGLNLWGLFKNPRFHQLWNFWAIISWILLWMINGNWWSWWFGDSFGNRAFIEVLIPLSTGAALTIHQLFHHWNWKQRVFAMVPAGILVGLNLYIWAGYLFKQYPHGGNNTIADVYLWPFK